MDVGRLCLGDAYWNDLAAEIDMSARYAAGMGERGLAAVLRRLGPSNEAKSFMAAVASENERRRMRQQRPVLGYRAAYNRLRAHETSTAEVRSMVRRWRKDGRTKDIEGLASMYTREEYPDIRASLLEVFSAPGLQCECYLPLDERIGRIRRAVADMPQVEVDTYDCLTTDFCRQKGAGYILRGVRDSSDFAYEQKIADINRLIAPDIETVILLAEPQYAAISSSMVRELAAFGKDVNEYVV